MALLVKLRCLLMAAFAGLAVGDIVLQPFASDPGGTFLFLAVYLLPWLLRNVSCEFLGAQKRNGYYTFYESDILSGCIGFHMYFGAATRAGVADPASTPITSLLWSSWALAMYAFSSLWALFVFLTLVLRMLTCSCCRDCCRQKSKTE
eukprot:gnl/TRDRNA2_/TRDRNA2_193316_c0_seq1.p1 gnl/TRDRNA2_/TRDRNA2_193316_c0~~gnl/TRDRNA2_/TRDRNA2_193316_c0_seq1.p1  ORF type:complete len:148 (-),score=12.42 gnl/TRDRNA2_/TRDRNA2_193316_c0_seq1:55-498(-)